MKIFDCTTFYNENLMLEVRFNILNKYVDKFVISEAKYSHSGEKKKLNFDIKKFNEFKNKIIYLTVENEPEDIKYETKNNLRTEKKSDLRKNSVLRISHQRNMIMDCLNEASDDDYIFYSDNDEIPNFKKINFNENKNKIIIFKQKLFYYKFNLLCDWVDWYGTKGCRKKFLHSIPWIREIKAKKYPIYRLDTIFSKNKYTNISIIEDGGWHFSQLKTPEEIEIKLLNQEHHDEYREAKKKGIPTPADLVRRKTISYDFNAKSSDYKFSKEFKLKTSSTEILPEYLKNNIEKYSEWFDFEK